jgi:TonB dependent receptor/CarboxypepD_reg-like domain/TonB-dependent Receptor Plug Domain
MMKFIGFLFFIITQVSVLAQKGSISGKLTDGETGEELIGASVVIKNTTNGQTTDLDGKFTIANLVPGNYDLQCSYISYETKTIASVAVKVNEVTIINVVLSTASLGLTEVVIEAKALRSNETSMLTMQKKSIAVMDGISNEQFTKLADSDAGGALRRVTGVSVEGGKYVYVRGLGDRYSKTTLNNAEIPGLDPNKNSVQLDLFPANLIDNIAVFKTYSADLPADFTGGYINISTKDFPEYLTWNFSTSLGYNTNATFNNNFLDYKGSNTDWLGFDNGFRDKPSDLPQPFPTLGRALTNTESGIALDKATKSFNNIMEAGTNSPFLNQKVSFSVGNQKKFLKKPFGFIFGISYQSDNEFYDDGKTERYTLASLSAEKLNNLIDFKDTQSKQNILLGGLLNLSYKLSDNNKLSFNLMRNQGGTDVARSQIGYNTKEFGEDKDHYFTTQTLAYSERALTNFQVKGEHYLEKILKTKIDWHSAYTISEQNEPDTRFFSTDYIVQENDTVFNVSQFLKPSRYFRNLNETNWDNKINFSIPFQLFKNLESKLKFGASILLKERIFEESRFDYPRPGIPIAFDGNITNYLGEQNLGIISNNEITGNPTFGIVLQDATELRNSYNADQSVVAFYASTDLRFSNKIKLNIGARVEQAVINTASKDKTLIAGKLDNTDILPGINFIYELNEKNNLRLSYSNTIARPTFRELAPFASFDFVGDNVLVGNPNLKRTQVSNYDFRWELYPRNGELLSVGVFYKQFINPIEKVIEPQAQNTQFSFKNVDEAILLGAEFELRKKLDFVKALENFNFGLNLSLIKSEVDISPEEYAIIVAADPSREAKRTLFAQSPYLVNALLGYKNDSTGTNINVSFNVFGERLAIVGIGLTPNVYEKPRPVLNATFSQAIGKQRKMKVNFNATNILNPYFNQSYTYKGNEYAFQKNKTGVTYSLGISFSL